MGVNSPRRGSLAYYPRVRAAKETPSFRTVPKLNTDETKPMNFLAYKVGMLHATAINKAEKTTSFNQEIVLAGTVIECPSLQVLGVKTYKKTPYGKKIVGEALHEKRDKHLERRMHSITRKTTKKDKKVTTLETLLANPNAFDEIRLLVHSNPATLGFGKKKPDVTEIHLSGNKENQITYAKEKFGQSLKVSEVFEINEFIDARAVNKGKGFQGVVKRFNVKIMRHKEKKNRVVGSIGPWHPATVMWAVPRPGQMGYHNRTDYNKRILVMSDDPSSLVFPGGFLHYGNLASEYIFITGSIPGPAKRAIALRKAIRSHSEKQFKVTDLQFINTIKKKKLEAKKEVKEEKSMEVKKEVKPEVKKEAPVEKKEVTEKPKEAKKAEVTAEAK